MADILLVDDDLDFLLVFGDILKSKGGHEIRVASNGADALKILDSGAQPDLVISDVLMPGISGFTLLAQLRERGLKVPVAFTSSLGTDAEAREEGMQLGAVDFVSKPIEEESMLRRVDALLEQEAKRRARRPPPTIDLLDDDILEVSEPEPVPSIFPQPDLTGSLQRIPLPAIFALAEAERSTAVLAAIHEGTTFWLTISEGRPVRASTTGVVELKGVPAIAHAIDWQTGNFEMKSGEVEGEDELQVSFTGLLMRVAQEKDEAGR